MSEKHPMLGEMMERICCGTCGLKSRFCEQTFVEKTSWGNTSVGWECSFGKKYQKVMSWSEYKRQNGL